MFGSVILDCVLENFINWNGGQEAIRGALAMRAPLKKVVLLF